MYFNHVVERLSGRPAGRSGEAAAITCDTDGGEGSGDSSSLSYAELDLAARAVAVWLSEHCAPGERVLLLSPLGVELVKNVLGCLYAGVVPVVAPVPDGRDPHLSRATGIAFDAEARVVLTEASCLSAVHDWLSQDGMGELTCVATDAVPLGDPADWVEPRRDPGELALLSYGSGEGELVGTAISAAALGHGLRRTADALGLTEEDRVLSWLPPDQYSGLMAVLTALSVGATTVLLSPDRFRRDPLRWLELVHRHRITVSGGGPGAYGRCADAAAERGVTGLDLSSWRVAYTSTAMLDPATLTRFARVLAPAGFDQSALRVSYCLPEAGFLVSTTDPRPLLRTARVSAVALEKRTFAASTSAEGPVLVSSGRVARLDLRVVDPESGRPLPDRRVGEVWVRGDGLASGYWRRGGGTDLRFGATLDTGEGGFFRTGDIGVLDAGELFVLGRADSMLTVAGRTIRAHDVERELAERFPALAGHPASVFTVAVPRHEVVVVQELDRVDRDELRLLAGAVRSWLRRRTRVRFGSVVFLQPGQLPAVGGERDRRELVRALFAARAVHPVYEELDGDVRRLYREPTGHGVEVVTGDRVAV
ncbi:AMP-binding protein [Saccharothrix coeruleofusca]|uniref:AMP-binding protein n=1 Tax=Saccharothrix coeruleofusca TaxID=33919 RepID=A0A918ASL1_9PSEU|nr:AMP-binding protein [Saccharothrix coeruleofusca]GGP78186.1 AMP-binding protein [Saccharothrix coeruleofusca]